MTRTHDTRHVQGVLVGLIKSSLAILWWTAVLAFGAYIYVMRSQP